MLCLLVYACLLISICSPSPAVGQTPSIASCSHPHRSIHECHYDVWDYEKSVNTCCPEEMEAWVELKRREHVVEVAVIITIITLTIVFDAAKESLINLAEKRSNHILVRIINSVNSEFATLGFVALLFGVLESRLQALGPISDHIFGDHIWVMYGPHKYAAWVEENLHGNPQEHHGPHCLSHLTLIFEAMHFSIFYLMIGFIVVCAAFTLSVLKHAEKSDFVMLVKEHFDASTSRSCWSTISRSRTEQSRMIDYLYFRTEFFSPITSSRVVAKRQDGFDFLIYMEHCLAESCTGQIQLDAGTLILLGVVFIPMYLLAKMRGLKGIILMCALPWMLLLLVIIIRRDLSRVVDSLKPTYEKMFEVVTKDPMMSPRSIEHLHSEALYLSDRNHFKANGRFMSLLRGTTVPTMHENVFFLQKNGPAFTSKALQVVCFATALYSGCLIFRLVDFTIKRWRKHWFLLPVGALPILIIIIDLLPSALERLVISTSVCQMKRLHVVMKVKKMLEAQRCELCLHFLHNVKLLSMHYLLTEAPDPQRNRIREKLRTIYGRSSPHTKALYMKMWKRFFAERRGVHTGKNIRSTLAAAGVTSQATSLFLSWMEMSTAPDSGELGFHEFCIIMIALRVAMNSVINEEEFSATIRRALASRTIEDSASASETVLTPEDVRDLLEEFKVVHPREHVIARHKTNVSSGRRLLEVKDRSGHDVHSPLAEAVMLVTAIENDNVYVRDDLTREQENVHITLLEFVRYFIELDIYQSHDPKNSSAEPFDHTPSLEFTSE